MYGMRLGHRIIPTVTSPVRRSVSTSPCSGGGAAARRNSLSPCAFSSPCALYSDMISMVETLKEGSVRRRVDSDSGTLPTGIGAISVWCAAVAALIRYTRAEPDGGRPANDVETFADERLIATITIRPGTLLSLLTYAAICSGWLDEAEIDVSPKFAARPSKLRNARKPALIYASFSLIGQY